MNSSPHIVVVGSANTDMVIKVERIPAPGETVIGGEFVMAAGGKGANQAVAAARLGARVTFVARLGADIFGERALAGYEREGIDISFIVRDPDVPSGVALIFVDANGENSIAVASGANAHLTVEDVERAAQAIATADVLLVQLEVPIAAVRRALELARYADVPTVLNPAPAMTVAPDILSLVDVVTPNEHEIRVVAGEPDMERAIARLLDTGIGDVIVTQGARGVLWAGQHGRQVVPAFPVTAVDTTAAGDAFNGALACALGRGWSVGRAIHYANAAAALTVTRMGAQPSLPTGAEVENFLRERGVWK